MEKREKVARKLARGDGREFEELDEGMQRAYLHNRLSCLHAL